MNKEDFTERNRLILNISNNIDQFIHHVKEQHNTTIDIHTDALMYSAFKSLRNLIENKIIPKEHIESYFLTLLNEYLGQTNLNLYVAQYKDKPINKNLLT